MSNLFYMQDARSYCGNDILFWAQDHCGYTTDISKAHVFTENEAMEIMKNRKTDIAWQKDYIDSIARKVVDYQDTSLGFKIRIENENN